MKNEDFHRTAYQPDEPLEWDREAVWSQIERDLDRRRRRPLLPFWWLMLPLLGLLLVVGWRIFHSGTTPGTTSPEPPDHTIHPQAFEVVFPAPPTALRSPWSASPSPMFSWSLSAVAGKKTGQRALSSNKAPFHITPNIDQLETPISTQPEPELHHIIPNSGITIPPVLFLPGLNLSKPLLSTTPPVWSLPRLPSLDKREQNPVSTSNWEARRFWEIQAGWLYADRHIRPRSSAGGAYSEALRRSFDLCGAFHVTARFYQPLPRKITLHAGIQYQRTAHWFDFKTSTSETSNLASDSAAFYQFSGTTHFVPGNRMQTVTTVRNYHSPGRLERLLLPVGIGWAPHASSGWFADGGIAIPIASRYRGYILNPQQEISGKSQGSLKNIYNTSGSFAAFGQLGYRVPLHNHWRLSCTMFVQGDMGNLWRNSTNVRVQERLLGLKLGLIGW